MEFRFPFHIPGHSDLIPPKSPLPTPAIDWFNDVTIDDGKGGGHNGLTWTKWLRDVDCG